MLAYIVISILDQNKDEITKENADSIYGKAAKKSHSEYAPLRLTLKSSDFPPLADSQEGKEVSEIKEIIKIYNRYNISTGIYVIGHGYKTGTLAGLDGLAIADFIVDLGLANPSLMKLCISACNLGNSDTGPTVFRTLLAKRLFDNGCRPYILAFDEFMTRSRSDISNIKISRSALRNKPHMISDDTYRQQLKAGAAGSHGTLVRYKKFYPLNLMSTEERQDYKKIFRTDDDGILKSVLFNDWIGKATSEGWKASRK